MDELVRGLVHELELRKDYLGGRSISTLYFGGGTPSLLSARQLDHLIQKVLSTFSCKLEEVTLEANPDDLNPTSLRDWKDIGIDRLSLGIQSFDDHVLRYYNRAHTAEDSLSAIGRAREAGFEKFSLDLIYGFPSEDHSIWHQDLKLALEQDPGHISAYALTVEPKTALGKWTERGQFLPAEEDFMAEQFEWLQSEALKAGYTQYEISNFGKAGQFAIHNSSYWKGIPYLGIGPSAHSFDGKDRGCNPASNAGYLKAVHSGNAPFQIDPLTLEEALNEKILTGLRTIWGVNTAELQRDYGRNILHEKKDTISEFVEKEWLNWHGNTLYLTPKGMLLADSIAAALFI